VTDAAIDLARFLFEAGLSWTLFGWVVGLVTAVLAVVTGTLLGHGGNIVFNVALTVSFFCLGGALSSRGAGTGTFRGRGG
jgi:hypothetical protein